MGFLNNLFGKKQKPAFDIEKAVSDYLQRLPQCNKDVVIVSPKYGEKYFTCEIVVAAKDLLPWTERHAVEVLSLNKEEQAARQALPLWLRCADSSNKSSSYVPHFMFKVLRLYVQTFIKEGTARVFCLECQSFVSDLNRKKINETRSGDWSWWTDVWACPQGHQLYYEEHKLHIFRRL